MLKKIVFGKTQFNDLHELFDFSEEQLENKKVRLFPSGNTNDEIHTTSIFLSSLCAVKEYREFLFNNIGIKKITNNNVQIHAYCEVASLTKTERTDALIVITTGKYSPIIEWAAFVESKVGTELINQPQIDRYINFAQDIGINNIITISNQLVTKPTDSPASKGKKKSFNLYHWSWVYLKVTAGRLINGDSILDQDHAYILNELRRYFENHKKLSNYKNMGSKWKESVSCVRSGTSKAEHIEFISSSLIQEEKDNCLQLIDNTGLDVELITKGDRKEKISNYLSQEEKVVKIDYCITTDTKYFFTLEVDFKLREITCVTKHEIKKGKAKAQTTQLIKLLSKESGVPDNIKIIGIYPRNKKVSGKNISLNDLITEKEKDFPYSIIDSSYGDEFKHFEIKIIGDLPGNKFQSGANFVIELESYTLLFVEQVMRALID